MKGLLYINLVFIVVLIVCCTENELIIIDNRGKIDSSSIDTSLIKGEYLVNFYPQIYNQFVSTGSSTSAVQAFPKGNRAQIFVRNYNGKFIQWPIYQALSAGSLSPVEDPIVVINGNYRFYSTSVNNANNPPIMSNSKVTSVNNGIDYLWNYAEASISANNTTVPILFTHSTAQIVIIVNNEDDSQLVDWISYVMLQVPDTTNIYWNLYNGNLEQIVDNKAVPSQKLSYNQMVMSSSGLTSTLCVLPLQYEGSMSAYLSLKMQGVTTGDSITGFDVELPIPNNELVAGNSYHYTINFARDTVTIGDVEIESWIIVDLEGNPLYPDIKEL